MTLWAFLNIKPEGPMAKIRQRILLTREEYFRSLLPGAKDEKTRQALLAVIEEEGGRFGKHAEPEESARDAELGQGAR